MGVDEPLDNAVGDNPTAVDAHYLFDAVDAENDDVLCSLALAKFCQLVAVPFLAP